MKTIYLHIGVHKTASTALQSFYWKNKELLRQQNIEPIHVVDGHKFYSCFLWHHPWRAFLDAEKPRTEWINSFLDRLQNISMDNILISSEFFCVLNKDLIKKLQRFLDSYHVKIICYIRRQDLWLESFYQELVKAEPVFAPPFNRWLELLPPFPTMVCNSYDMLKNWTDIFGLNSMIVRPFEKQQLKNGNILDDFLSLLGLELTDDYQQPDIDDLNVSLSRTIIEFIRTAKQIPVETRKIQVSASIPKYISRKIIGLAPESTKIPKGQRCSFLSDQERLNILHQYEQNNRKIAFEFLDRQDGRLFYEPLPEFTHDNKLDPHQLYFHETATTLTEMIYTLNKRVEELEKQLREFRFPFRKKIKYWGKQLLPTSMYALGKHVFNNSFRSRLDSEEFMD